MKAFKYFGVIFLTYCYTNGAFGTVDPNLQKVFDHIQNNQESYIQNFKEAVAIKSVSTIPENRPDTIRMVQFIADKLTALGFTVELKPMGEQVHSSGVTLQIPDMLFATLGNDPTKTTVLLYGHLDVQPGKIEDGWDTEPFDMTNKDGKLFGRGTTDDKGPVLGWLHAIKAYQKNNVDLPINIKFIFEAMEESGSPGLDALVMSEKDKFFKGVDIVAISDSYWVGKDRPCLSFGLRGLAYFFLEIECAARDLHSGIYGGSVYEAMADLIYMLNTLSDSNGTILVPGLMDTVLPLEDKERGLYDKIDFDLEEYRNDIGAHGLRHNGEKTKLLMHRWRYPSFSIHGIQGAFSNAGAKTVIPRKVIGKFSLRLIPNQEPNDIAAKVINYVNEQWVIRNSPNKMKIHLESGGKPWIAEYDHPNYQAAARAIQSVWGVEPLMIREGATIPVALTLQEVTGKNVLLLPMGSSDDGAHSQNEKLNIKNYIEGTKVMAAYLWEVIHANKADFV